MKKLTALIVAVLMALAIAPAAVFADGSIDWFNTDPPKQGDEHLAPDAAEGEECGSDDSLIHWIFTAGPPNANTVSAATLHLNGHTYTGDNNGASWHFTTPLIELADITEAYVDYVGDVGDSGVGLRISHVCRVDDPTVEEVPPPTIVKTANGVYTKTWTWNVDKDVTTAPKVEVQPGGTASFGYSIKVTHSGAAISDIRVRGIITVTNNSDFDIPVTVTEHLSDATADCELRDDGTVTLDPNASIDIAYRCIISGDSVPEGLTNKAKVEWDGFENDVDADNIIWKLIAGHAFSDPVDVEFKATKIDECTTVTDSNAAFAVKYGSPVVVCVGDKDADGNDISEPTFTYTRNISAPADFGCFDYDNTAKIKNNDTGDEKTSKETVTVCKFRARLTPGYWKTHLTSGTPTTTSLLGAPVIKLGDYDVDTATKVTNVFNAMNCGASTTQGAIGCLAGHLLATELNLKNSTNTCIVPTRDAADAFLRTDLNINIANGQPYTGPTGVYVLTDARRAEAIALKTALDTYNNGGGCI